MSRMLGAICWSLHNHSGHRCGECESGWPRGRRAQKRRESRQVRREIEQDQSTEAAS